MQFLLWVYYRILVEDKMLINALSENELYGPALIQGLLI